MQFDLVIVGGGLVGGSLASALRHLGWRIAVVEASLPKNDDPRLFALNASSCQFLQKLDLWDEIKAFAAPIHQVHVSRQNRFGSVRLKREEALLDALGYVIPACHIEAALNKQLQTLLNNIFVFRPAKLIDLKITEMDPRRSLPPHVFSGGQDDSICEDERNIRVHERAILTLQTPSGEITIQSTFVIGADGTESTVRKQLNMGEETNDYAQSAIVTRTELRHSHQNVAYERFEKNGAIAMLPLLGNECATIWTADNAKIAELMALDDASFLQSLQKTFGYRLGSLLNIKKRFVFPIRMTRAKKILNHCVLLLGNAAHTLSPLAAQGFNLALYEVAVLAEFIMDTLAKDEKFSATHLQQVSELITKQQSMSIGVSHQLTQIFSNRAMNFALPMGMIGLDLCAPIKKKFIAGMLGKIGHVPRLLLDANE